MRAFRIAVASTVLLATGAGVLTAQTPSPRVFSPQDQSRYAPPVDVWLDRDTYDYGEKIRPSFQSEPGAYVTIVRVTSDGELRVMYPRRPETQRSLTLGEMRDGRVPYDDYPGFNVYESSGIGFVFAIASYKRFDYSYYSTGGGWSIARLASAGRYGDPFEIVRMFVENTLDDQSEFSMDYVTYEVRSSRMRSRYSTRYAYNSLDDYYDRCLNAFGFRYTNYCGYGSGYYYPLVVVNPASPSPRGTREPRVRPLVPDPMVPHLPREPQAIEGRQPVNVPGEAAASARRERMLRDVSPRIEMRTGGTMQPMNAEPRRMEPRSEPRIERDPVFARPAPRTEPLIERDPVFARPAPRTEPVIRPEPMRAEPMRAEPRVQQAPARIEVRVEPRPQPVHQSDPVRVEPRPVQKDNQEPAQQ